MPQFGAPPPCCTGDIKGWMLATVLAIVGTMAALTYGLFSSLKMTGTATPTMLSPPVIINNLPPQPATPQPAIPK
jgi:hypothetical protein